MELIPVLLGSSVVVLIGAAFTGGWFLARREVKLLQDECAQLTLDKQQYQIEQARVVERALGLQKALEQQQAQAEKAQNELEQRNASLQASVQLFERRLAGEQEARAQEQKNTEEKIALLNANKAQLLQEFENLSQKIYDQKQQQFKEQSQQGLNAVLTPFKEQLEGLRKRVDEVHGADIKDRSELKNQIEHLHKLNQQITEEAKALTSALRGENKTQGNWGEMILETVLERSGLRKGEEYVREQVLHDENGKIYRPDVIINLPENKHLVVDSKVTLTAYTDYVNATTDEERERAAKAHVDSVRNHINTLSEKAYQQLTNINTPDFVFLFMPIESAFMLAFQRDEKLFETAFDKRIVVVTPTTLLATLRTVNSIWTLERRSRSSEKLADQASKLYDKLVLVVERFEKVGNQLNTVKKSYDDAWGSLKEGRGNLISQSQQLLNLGVRVKKELARELVEEALEQNGTLELSESAQDE